jgi:hypothetical protein
MTITHSVDHDRRELVAIAIGAIGYEEVRTHLLVERREGGLSYAELIDARSATPTWSTAEARTIVTMLTAFGRESVLGPTAVVVSTELAYGMLRMLEIMLEDVCIVRPFLDYAAAEQWLRDLPRDA